MTPSAAIAHWAPFVAAGGPVLDVAAGGGRHAILFADRGHPTVAVDRDVSRLRALADDRIEILEADLEDGPWPLANRTFAGVVVSNYLWRPILPDILACIAPGGALLYETFAAGNEQFGRPRNPEFLLRPGELIDLVADGFEVRDYWHGVEGDPPTAVRQRICALRHPPA